MLKESNKLQVRLRSNVTRFRTGIKKAGFNVAGHDSCPIAPVMLGDARLAAQMADALLEKGIFVIGFSYPVVPKGQARIRT
jgi:glycine C-acetyltransferase